MVIGSTATTPDFLVGFLTAIFIPLSSFLYNCYKNKKELNEVKIMIFKEYVDTIDQYIEGLNQETSTDLTNLLRKKKASLNSLLENEIKFMNSENQFKIIRMIEYTNMYLELAENKMIIYSYVNNPFSPIENEVVSNIPSDLRDLTKAYKITLDDYINLKRDRLV